MRYVEKNAFKCNISYFCKRFSEYAKNIDELCVDLKKYFSKATYTHSNPDFAFVLKYGFNEIKKKLREELIKA